MIRSASLILVALVACTPSPSPPHLDGGDASTASVQACAHLAALGCDEGTDAHCAVAFDRIVANPQVARVDLPCLTAASNKASVRACSSLVTCP